MNNINILEKLKGINSDFVFLLLLVVFSMLYYDSVMDKGPLNAHLWRQTDCLSMTRNYMNGANFLEPEMDILLADNHTTGKSAGEFPILYYVIGFLWSVFGESYLLYRSVYLLIVAIGLFALFRSVKLILNDSFWAIIITFLLFSSPVYVFYGVSFLTDAPAFSFVLVGLYFFLQYHTKKKMLMFFLSMIFFALAGLLKVSSLIAFIFLGMIVFIELFNIKTLGTKKVYHTFLPEAIGFVFVLLSIFSWYYYAGEYNELHGFKYTFNSIYPLWNMSEIEQEPLVSGVKNFTSIVFFSRPILYMLFVLGCVNLFLYKKISVFAYLSSITIIIGAVLYFVLWGPLMGIHDYYYVALLILFLGVVLPFASYVKEHYSVLFNGRKLKVFLSLFLVFNFGYCLSVVNLKTLGLDGSVPLVGNHRFVENMRWANWDTDAHWKSFEEIKIHLDDMGIKPEDKIISLPDQSFNSSLFLIGHKGWTNYKNYKTKEDIDFLIQKGAKYLFISDPIYLEKDHIKPFLYKKVGEFKNIKIFKLTK